MNNRRQPRIQSRAYEHRRLQTLASLATGSVLDLGYAALPNPFLVGEVTVGVDLDIPVEPTGYAEEHIGSVMDLESVLGSRAFDTIIAGELIEHLREPYRFLDGLHSFMRDGAKLLLSTPNPLGIPAVVFEYLCSTRYFYAPDHTYYFTPRWVRRMLESCGFLLDGMHGVGIWLPRGPVIRAPASISYQVVYQARRA